MDKRSSHYGDVKKWIEKVIDSCETYEQTFTAKKLINNFSKNLIKFTSPKTKREFYNIITVLELELSAKKQELRG
jgi:hypothetical protein